MMRRDSPAKAGDRPKALSGGVQPGASWIDALITNVALAGLICGCMLAPSAFAWKQREFVTSFWSPPPPAETTADRYKEIKDAHFTTVMPGNGIAGSEWSHKMLDLAHQAKLKAFVMDGRLTGGKVSEVDTAVREYAGESALEGYYLQDEPSTAQFAGLRDTVAALKKADGKRLAFINLFPTYASPAQMGAPTYEEYVKQYLDTVQPEMLCFDHYPYTTGGERPDYLENLEIIRRQSLDHKIPFWAIVQSEGIQDAYHSPSETEMRDQVFTALAYGAKGILYFTYWTPDDSGPEKHFDGIIPLGGKARARYRWVQRLNEEIGNLGPTLMTLRSKGVYQVGIKAPGTQPVSTKDFIRSVKGGPATIGVFEGEKKKTFFWVANRDPNRATRVEFDFYPEQVARLFEHTLDGKVSINLLHTDVKIPPALNVVLGPGEGRFFEIPETLR